MWYNKVFFNLMSGKKRYVSNKLQAECAYEALFIPALQESKCTATKFSEVEK